MLPMQTFREPALAVEALTPANLPPSAADLATGGRSLFNEVLMAIRKRHRAYSNYSGIFLAYITHKIQQRIYRRLMLKKIFRCIA